MVYFSLASCLLLRITAIPNMRRMMPTTATTAKITPTTIPVVPLTVVFLETVPISLEFSAMIGGANTSQVVPEYDVPEQSQVSGPEHKPPFKHSFVQVKSLHSGPKYPSEQEQ